MSASKMPFSPIAVVGVSALFPGSVSLTGFWHDILAGRDLISDVPPSHWLVEDYYDPDPSTPDKIHVKRGAFLDSIDLDALAWGIPPSTIESTDTSQLLALIVAQQVLEDAARGRLDTLDRSRISVILGVTSAQELLGSMVSRLQQPVWASALRSSGLPEDQVQAICERISGSYVPWQESTFPGLLGNVVAGRIANRLDLGGTNCVTDAACASSLSAVNMAVAELLLGDSDMVITGGVDTLNDIFMFMCFGKTQAMSLTGDCRPFSDQADGTMLGEGLGMVALKRLEDAERDHDRIYAVIRGIGTSSDGRSKSVYAPVPQGQATALTRAYDKAGYSPATVELVEAHGTGTKAGDAAELEGLRMVFGESGREDLQWCALGSVKSQIGHTKAAAGAAGLLKAVMALHHKVLPPTIKADRPNPSLKLESSPFYLNQVARPWIRGSEHPRRASVSAFGFGGSNFHVTLEEPTGSTRQTGRLACPGPELIVLGADDAEGLASRARAIAEDAARLDSLTWLARSTQADYDHTAAARLAVLAADGKELAEKLEAAATRITEQPGSPFVLPDGSCHGVGEHQGEVAFLFPGQGSQYVGMGADLAMCFDSARAPWDRAADLGLDPELSLHEVVFPRPGTEDDDDQRHEQRLRATEWAQPAIGCVSQALLALLRQLGLEPAIVAGHSFGEVTALHAAGVLSADDMLRVARKRGELMAEAARIPGAMTALSRPIEEVRELIARLAPGVTIANHNGPEQVVVSGPTGEIETLEARLRDERIRARRIAASTAFHSPVVSGSCAPFARFLADIELGEAAIPVLSCATAEAYAAAPEATRQTLAGQIAQPVRFVEMVQAMYAAGARTFIEVGPGSVLTALADRILKEQPHLAIALDRKGRNGLETLLRALAQLVAAGVPLRLEALWSEHRAVANPLEQAAPKLAVSICGTNHGKLYPPAGGADALPRPIAPGPAEVASLAPVPSPVRLPEQQPSEEQMPQDRDPDARPEPTPGRLLAGQPTDLGTDTAYGAPAVPPAHSTSLPDGWLDVFRDVQRQTAEAHATHQRAMADSHAAFLRTAEASLRGLSDLVSTGTAAPRAQVPLDRLDRLDRLDQLDPPAHPEPRESLAARPADPPVAPAHTMSPPPELAAPAAAIEASRHVEPAPAEAIAAHGPDLDLEAMMLEIVADKTGYPADMLEPAMQLERDLGVDSIKRVEILAAVQDRATGLEGIDAVHMTSLETLGAIAEYLNGLAPASASVPATSAVPNPAPTDPKRQATGAEVVDPRALMLEIVAEKTGYPADMLEPEMQLERDLGVDSIKRVEILAAVQDRTSGLGDLDAVHMTSLETLEQIAEYLEGQLAGSGPAVLSPAADTAAGPEAPRTDTNEPSLGRFSVQTIAAPATGQALPGLLSGAEVWITSDGTGLDQQLAALLNERGVNARACDTVPAGARCAIALDGLREPGSTSDAISVNRQVFATARTLAPQLSTGEGLLVTVQDTGGAFGLTGIPEGRAWLAGAPALAKTAAQEWPAASVKAIDIERGLRDTAELATALADELLTGGGEIEVGLTAGGDRLTLLSMPMPLSEGAEAESTEPIEDRGPRIEEGDVVVVSGGARGVTSACIVAWARECRARFVLLGRSRLTDEPACCAGVEDDAGLKRALLNDARAAEQAPSPAQLDTLARQVRAGREIRATLAAISAAGAEARYEPVDVTDHDALADVLDRVRSELGPIAGLVHAAGVLADRPIHDTTDAQLDLVLGTKVIGLHALLSATATDPLKLVCVFSSVAARAGNAGQATYAMANEVLSKVAWSEARRRGPGTLVRSLCWGPWRGGMVTPLLEQRFEAAGVPLIPLEHGARMFVDELRRSGPEQQQVELVLGGEPQARPLLAAGHGGDPGPGLTMDIRIDRTSHPYLAGHAINGTPVVPMVLVLEWFSRAARSFRPGMRLISIRDIQVLKGIRLAQFDTSGDRLVIVVRPEPDAGLLRLELNAADGTPRYRAQLELARSAASTASTPSAAPDLPLEGWNGTPVYGGALFHQGPFQVIQAMEGISDLGAAGILKGVLQAGWADEPWQLDVAALDGGLQLAVLLTERLLGQDNLPTSIAEVRTWSDRPGSGPIRCVASRRHLSSTGATTDIVLMDHEGRGITSLNGVQTHLLPGQSRAVAQG